MSDVNTTLRNVWLKSSDKVVKVDDAATPYERHDVLVRAALTRKMTGNKIHSVGDVAHNTGLEIYEVKLALKRLQGEIFTRKSIENGCEVTCVASRREIGLVFRFVERLARCAWKKGLGE